MVVSYEHRQEPPSRARVALNLCCAVFPRCCGVCLVLTVNVSTVLLVFFDNVRFWAHGLSPGKRFGLFVAFIVSVFGVLFATIYLVFSLWLIPRERRLHRRDRLGPR